MKFLVHLKDKKDYNEALEIFELCGYTVIEYFEQIGLFSVEGTVFANFEQIPIFEIMHENKTVSTAFVANDPIVSSQWNITTCNFPQAWNTAFGDGAVVAVLDTGFETTHTELSGQLLAGRNVVDNNTDVSASYWHGTAVVGIIAAILNNNLKIAGGAPNAKVLPVKISTDTSGGTASFGAIIAGILWAVDNGAHIISLSYDISDSWSVFDSSIGYAAANNVLFINGVSNSSGNVVLAKTNEAIAVCGMDSSYHAAYGYGAGVDITSCSVGIPSLNVGNGNGTFNGNSFGCPLVSAAAALIKSAYFDYSWLDIKEILLQSANQTLLSGSSPGWQNNKGWGVLDVSAAMTLAATWKRKKYRKPIALFSNLAPQSTLAAGSTINLTFTLVETSGNITQVRLLQNGVQIATGDKTTLASYNYTVPAVNTYILTLEVTDDLENVVTDTIIFDSIGVYSTGNLSYAVPVTNTQSFQVRMRASNESGASAWSSWTTINSLDTVPVSPTLYGANYAVAGQATVYVRNVAGATGYKYVLGGSTFDVVANTITIPLTNAIQALTVYAYNAHGNGNSALLNIEAMPSVNTDLKSWYNVNVTYTQVSADLGATFALIGLVNANSIASYNIVGKVSADLSSSYVIINSIIKDAASSYNILTSSSVTESLAAAYNVIASVQSDEIAAYNLIGNVSKDLITSSNIVGSLNNSLTSNYSVRGSVNLDLFSNFSIINAINSSLASSYNILNSIAKDITGNFNVTTSVNSDLAAIFIDISSVLSSITSSYNLINTVNKDIVSIYNISNSVVSSTSGTYAIIGTVQKDASGSYNVLSGSAVTSDIVCNFYIFGIVAVDLVAINNTIGKVTSDISSVYLVYNAVVNNLTSSYSVVNSVDNTLSGSYTMIGALYADLTPTYKIITAITKDLVVSYLGSNSSNGADAASVWNFMLANGLTAQEAIDTIQTLANDIALLHGLIRGKPLLVTSVSRSVDTIDQVIEDTGSTVTITRN